MSASCVAQANRKICVWARNAVIGALAAGLRRRRAKLIGIDCAGSSRADADLVLR